MSSADKPRIPPNSRLHSACGLLLLTCLATIGLVHELNADDVVTISRNGSSAQTRRTGTILEYTGQRLTLRSATGQDEAITAANIVDIETPLLKDQENGDQLFAERHFADAVVAYRRAYESEQRRWMRRIILAQLVHCHTNQGHYVRAGDMFRLIVQSDPDTQLMDTIPLAWTATPLSSDLADRAQEWLDDPDLPAARLMGASWLYSHSQQQAGEVLQTLSRSEDPRLAALATTQLWRQKLVTATERDARRWASELEAMHPSLRAGPLLLLGQLQTRLGNHTDAALTLLRIPILFPDHHNLVSESLFAAGKALEQHGDREAASRIYRELLETCPEHALAPVAQQRLDKVTAN